VSAAVPGPPGGPDLRSWAPPPFEVHPAPVVPAEVVALHLDARASVRRGLGASGWRNAGAGPFIVGVAGGVAAGKSWFAEELRGALGGRRVEVISTDGFLYSNADLAARGLAARKGFPESYDRELAMNVLQRVAAGDREVAVPRYSHRSYDIEGPPHVIGEVEVLIVEGVVALQPPVADFCSLRIYLDADEPDVRGWFVERFVQLVENAQDDFYAQWAGMRADEVRRLATMVWEQVNLPNLVAHILPTRWTADLVVRKAADHSVAALAVRLR